MSIKKDSKKAPNLRFKGFTDDWEQRKLENVVEINPSSNLPNSFHYVDLESVKGTELIYSRIEHRDTAPSRAKRLARNGDVFFQLVRPYQKNNYLFNLEEKNYVFSTGYAQMRPSISSEYLINYLTTDKFIFQVLNRSTGSSYPAINSTDLIKIKIAIPQSELESFKIGRILESINQTITLHHRKLDQLNQLKEALLQKMFPGKGETVPKLRFAGFEGEWEEWELGELLKYEQPTNYIVQSTEYNDTYTTPVLTAGQSFILGFTNEKEGINRATKDNPVIIFDDFTTGSHLVDFSFKVKSSAMKILYRSNDRHNHTFLFYLLKNVKYEPQAHERHWISLFSNFKVKVANDFEQEKIGSLLEKIDNKIIFQQRKLDQLQNMKQVLLENMFI